MIRWMVLSLLAARLLYGLYCLTLRRDRWLQLSLWYLLVALGFCMVFPSFRLPDGLDQASRSVAHVGDYPMTLNDIEISATTAPQGIGVADIYLAGLAVCTA